MKFTAEEIALCKKVAEKHRKKIVYGSWLHNENYIEGEWFKKAIQLWRDEKSLSPEDSLLCNYTPLWQISDCLEFLSKKEVMWELSIEVDYTYWLLAEGNKIDIRGETILEVCLKAVLAILKS